MSNPNFPSKTNLTETLLKVRRVTKVVEGGRTFSFSAHVIVGNQSGSVGLGKGKASEVLSARSKAANKAKKEIITVPLYKGRTIHHDVEGQCGSTKILLRRARPGTGIIAGLTARSVLSMLGIRDIVAKSHGSSNVHTTARAIIDALSKLSSPSMIASRRGKKVHELFNQAETQEETNS
jgi:small subunit ribosomal protein S5